MNAQLSLSLVPPSGRYYQTTRLTADELNATLATVRYQDETVLALFRRFGVLTPSQAWSHYKAATGKHETPLTSIRRSITTLTETDKVLRKLDDQRIGPLGKPEHFWTLA